MKTLLLSLAMILISNCEYCFKTNIRVDPITAHWSVSIATMALTIDWSCEIRPEMNISKCKKNVLCTHSLLSVFNRSGLHVRDDLLNTSKYEILGNG